jgi:hypothetical protein
VADKKLPKSGKDDPKGRTARIQVIHEAVDGSPGEWMLCFQWCRYIYGDGNMEQGYRFIWRRPDGTLQAARGQARIPSIEAARKLMNKAVDEGWGKNKG